MIPRVKDIFVQVMDIEPDQFSVGLAVEDVEKWDSFNHVTLVEALSAEFQIEFDVEDMIEMLNVEGILTTLRRKGMK